MSWIEIFPAIFSRYVTYNVRFVIYTIVTGVNFRFTELLVYESELFYFEIDFNKSVYGPVACWCLRSLYIMTFMQIRLYEKIVIILSFILPWFVHVNLHRRFTPCFSIKKKKNLFNGLYILFPTRRFVQTQIIYAGVSTLQRLRINTNATIFLNTRYCFMDSHRIYGHIRARNLYVKCIYWSILFIYFFSL